LANDLFRSYTNITEVCFVVTTLTQLNNACENITLLQAFEHSQLSEYNTNVGVSLRRIVTCSSEVSQHYFTTVFITRVLHNDWVCSRFMEYGWYEEFWRVHESHR